MCICQRRRHPGCTRTWRSVGQRHHHRVRERRLPLQALGDRVDTSTFTAPIMTSPMRSRPSLMAIAAQGPVRAGQRNGIQPLDSRSGRHREAGHIAPSKGG